MKKIVDPAVALREAGASMDTIKKMMRNNFKPTDSEVKKKETPLHLVENSAKEPDSAAFITDKVAMEDEEADQEAIPENEE